MVKFPRITAHHHPTHQPLSPEIDLDVTVIAISPAEVLACVWENIEPEIGMKTKIAADGKGQQPE
jgi:hypothetical protein